MSHMMSGWNLKTGEPSDFFLLFRRSILHKNNKLLPLFSVTPTKEGDQLFIFRVVILIYEPLLAPKYFTAV